jgi:DTW domain-containing protein YfiP
VGIRGSPTERCACCGLDQRACLCAELPRIETATVVEIVAHAHDIQRPSNTAKLVACVLAKARLTIFGDRRGEAIRSSAATSRLLLHPEGRLLTAADARPGLALVVPDGSWSQVRHMIQRVAPLRDAEWVRLPAMASARAALRRTPRGDYLCTLEAVARSLGILESPEIEAQLLAVLDEVVTRTVSRRRAVKLSLES